MKAMIFAAGLGTRLRPLTNDRPKAMVELGGKPLLQHAIEKLKRAGFDEIIINVHHFADTIESFLKKQNFGIRIEISDERDLLLDTGGGLKKAAWFFDDGKPFLVYNVDIFSDLDPGELYKENLKSGQLATLAVNKRSGNRFFLFNQQQILSGWANSATGERIITRNSDQPQPWYFCGVHVLRPEIFPLITEQGVFSIIEVYLRLSGQYPLGKWEANGNYWFDLGTIEKLQSAERKLSINNNK